MAAVWRNAGADGLLQNFFKCAEAFISGKGQKKKIKKE